MEWNEGSWIQTYGPGQNRSENQGPGVQVTKQTGQSRDSGAYGIRPADRPDGFLNPAAARPDQRTIS